MDIVSSYRRVYGLGDEVGQAEVDRHRALEGRLTNDILSSSPAGRWQVVSDSYTQLYADCPWLNKGDAGPPESWFAIWRRLIPAPSRIYEVGSGNAHLLNHLVAHGHDCVATEITKERGQKFSSSSERLAWRQSDGVHLAEFEPAEHYDVVISTQVIEHFHPDDVATHLSNVREILKPGGRYIFDTPHRSTGPHDLSRVFGLDAPQFMHLKEYSFLELRDLAKAAGFRSVKAVFRVKSIVSVSSLYLAWLCLVDRLESRFVHAQTARRSLRRLLRLALVPSGIWLVAER